MKQAKSLNKPKPVAHASFPVKSSDPSGTQTGVMYSLKVTGDFKI